MRIILVDTVVNKSSITVFNFNKQFLTKYPFGKEIIGIEEQTKNTEEPCNCIKFHKIWFTECHAHGSNATKLESRYGLSFNVRQHRKALIFMPWVETK